MKIHTRFSRKFKLVLHSGDCFDLLREIPDATVALTVTSPPYCMGKEYDGAKSLKDFIESHQRVIPEIVRVTKPGGSICWQIGYYVRDSVITPLDYHVHAVFEKFQDILLRNRIVWTYGHGLHCVKRFSGRHEIMLWYTKGQDYTFNLDEVRMPQKYPGKRHYKGKNKGQLSGNPLGKNPSDIWDIPNVKANHVEKANHPCQFPVALALRAIQALSNPDDVVLDPFVGSGTTAVAAILARRRFVGAEVIRKYFKAAVSRCRDALKGRVRYRSPQIPVFVPTPTTQVAKAPPEFAAARNGFAGNLQPTWQNARNGSPS
jgi:adenine-specific DNA-methyltransferase